MFNAYIITTKFAFPENKKVAQLTGRCNQSTVASGLKPILFEAITPYTLEEYYPGWEVEIEYAKRLKANYERKSGNKISVEMMNRMLVMQMSMTMSHYEVRKRIIANNETAVVLEHDAVFLRPLPLYDYESNVVNLCQIHQQTHGYVTNAANAKRYNDQYEITGFVGHDNMSRHIKDWLKVTPFGSNPVVGGNHVSESQWDTHRGALKEKKLTYMPELPGIDKLLERI